MSPKEKSQELIDKYVWELDFGRYNDSEILKKAKQCAIICVEQIIEAFKQADGNQECTTIHIVHHWEEVLEHIKNS